MWAGLAFVEGSSISPDDTANDHVAAVPRMPGVVDAANVVIRGSVSGFCITPREITKGWTTNSSPRPRTTPVTRAPSSAVNARAGCSSSTTAKRPDRPARAWNVPSSVAGLRLQAGLGPPERSGESGSGQDPGTGLDPRFRSGIRHGTPCGHEWNRIGDSRDFAHDGGDNSAQSPASLETISRRTVSTAVPTSQSVPGRNSGSMSLTNRASLRFAARFSSN